MKRVLALAAGALLLLASPAYSQAVGYADPDDMTGPLDVRSLIHVPGEDDIHTLTVTTDDNWRCGYLDRGARMVWRFDGTGNNRIDLVGKIRCLKPAEGPRDLVLFLSGKDNSYEPIPVQRPDRHTMEAEFSFDIPELNGRHLDVIVKVKDSVAEGCSTAHKCIDRAPNRGRWSLY